MLVQRLDKDANSIPRFSAFIVRVSIEGIAPLNVLPPPLFLLWNLPRPPDLLVGLLLPLVLPLLLFPFAVSVAVAVAPPLLLAFAAAGVVVPAVLVLIFT